MLIGDDIITATASALNDRREMTICVTSVSVYGCFHALHCQPWKLLLSLNTVTHTGHGDWPYLFLCIGLNCERDVQGLTSHSKNYRP